MKTGSSVETVESAGRFQEEVRCSGREGERERREGEREGERRVNERVQVPRLIFPCSLLF